VRLLSAVILGAAFAAVVRGDDGDGGGIPGPQGPQGVQGPQGIPGLQGPMGFIGPMGPQGRPGFNGANGVNGTQGVAGAMGATGAQGQTGKAGAAGVQGPAGPAQDVPAIDPRLDVEVREYDAKHWAMSSYASFGMQSGTSRYIVGQRLTLKLGRSSEQRELDQLRKEVEQLRLDRVSLLGE
jgi:hypothetical protein